MTLNEYLQREGKTLDSIKKGKTLTQYIQEEKIKPYYETIDLTNSLVTDWNNRTTADYSKYGDYSSHTAQYDDFSSRSRQILSNLEKNKKLFTEEQYSEIRKLAEDIGNNSVTAKEAVQSIVDQYSAYTPEQKNYAYYTNYDIAAAEEKLRADEFTPLDPSERERLIVEIQIAKLYKSKQRAYEREAEFKETFGDMTPEEVDKYVKVFTDRINEGKGNKLTEYTLEWLQNYDLTYGVQSEEYYNQRLKLLNDKLAEEDAKTETYIVYNDNPMGAGTQTVHTEEYNKIKSEIEIITAARTSYVREQTFVDKGYDKYLEAEDFELYVEKHKDDEMDYVVYAYNNPEVFDKLRDTPDQLADLIMTSEKYSFLKEKEFWVYCYLKEKDKENGTNNAEQFCKDMETVLDKRRQEGRISEIRMEMNAGGIEGAWATVKYNALSIPANVFGGIAPAINDAVRAAMGKEINPYDASHDAINYASATRSITTDMIDSGIGKIVYNSLMSAADSAFGAATLGKFYLVAAATTASANQAKILYEQGASSEQIFLGSIASGTIEIITEKIPLDNLLKPKNATTFLQILGEGLKQAGIEGAEEMVSEIFNDVSDEVIRGAMSEFNQSVRTYKETGYSDKGAYFKAMGDSFGDILEAGLSGFISGGVTGTVKTAADSHNLKKIGEIIIEEGNIDTVLMAAKSMGELDAEIAGQVQALENNKKTTNKKGEYNAAYKRMLGKVAVSTAQSVAEVKQNVTKKAVSNELHRRGVDKKTADKVTDIVSKYVSGQKLSSAEQGYLKNNLVASNIVHEISLAQEQVKATEAGVTGSKVANTGITPSEEGYTSSTTSGPPSPRGEGLSAPEWAVSLVNQLNTIDSAAQVVNMAVTGKSVEEEKNAETNRMIKLLSIASGKTTAQQEAEAGDIPYSQYIKEKEAAAKKENTAVSGEEVKEKIVTEGGDKYSIKYPTFSEEEMIDNAIELQNMDPVAELTGKEFPKSETSLRQRIVEYFNSLGNNVYTKLFGDVALTSSSVHDDLGHGITNNKVVSFAAVPEVLKNGVVIDSQRRGGNNYDRIVVAAPIKIGSQEYIMGVMLQRDHQSQRLYLHDVVSLNKEETMQNLETTPSTTEVSKKGDSLYMTSILQRALSVNSKSMQESENNTYSAKEISEADRKRQGERQEKVKSLCELFGLPLEWSDKVSRGKYNPNTRTITLNPNLTLTEMYIEVLKHEFTHDLENRKLYKKFKNYLFNNSEHFIKFCEEQVKKLKDKGIIDETATGRDAVYILRGYTYLVYKDSKELTAEEKAAFDREAAEREMICDFVAKKLLDKGNEAECIEALKELAENQRSAFDRFVDLIRNTIYHIKDAFGKTTLTDELKYLERRLKQVYESNVDKKKTAQGGEKRSVNYDKNSKTFDSPRTEKEIVELRSIGRKSVSRFTKEDRQKSRKWEEQHNRKLGIKSPFFRASFGDWRAHDIKNPAISTVISQQRNVSSENRKVWNTETGWEIQITGDFVQDSIHYANKDRLYILRLLTQIDEVLQKAILLDTATSDVAKNNKKGSSQFMHYLYSIVEYQGAPFLAKITVEEYDVSGKFRAYNVQRIKMPTLSRAQYSQLKTAYRGNYASNVDAVSVAQLFDFVKTYDKDFTYSSVNPELLNEDGTPKSEYLKKYGLDTSSKTEKHSIDLEENVDGKYSYNALISKLDMNITTVDDSIEYTATTTTRKNLITEAVENAATVGRTNENGNAVVYVNDIGTEVIVSKNGLRHGLDRRFKVLAPITVKAGEILQNAIRVNELIPRNERISKSYVLIGVAKNKKNEPYVVSFIVNRSTNEISSIDVLYSINTKTESAGSLSPSGFVNNTTYFTDSTISISDLLDLVNKYFPDILSEDVLRHYGHTSRPDGEIGKSALYSLDLEENVSERENVDNLEDISETTETEAETDIDEDIDFIPDAMIEIQQRYESGKLSRKEYKAEIKRLLNEGNERFGPIKQGEKAKNTTKIPRKVSKDKKVRRFARTVIESDILPDEIEAQEEAEILKEALSYKGISNKKAQAHANFAVQNGTAKKVWDAAVNGDGKVGKEHIAIGETLLKLAAERNDAYGVKKLVAELCEMATRAGQMVQAFSMLKRMDGIGKLYYLQKCVDTINKDLEKRFGQKYADGKIKEIPQVKINETLATQLAESKTQKDFDVTYEALLQSIAEQVPVTFSDKWNAWRYLAMLCNPRTHIRNFFGNGVFLPTVRLKDVCAVIIERMTLDEQKRTKSAIVKKEYRNFAQADYVNVEDIITGNGKMNPSNAIKDRQTVFDAKWLETLRKWNFKLLDKGDSFFLEKHYAHALGGFLQARNIDITKDVPMEVMEEARIYAMKEAQKATYRDASAIVNILNRISKTKVGAWNVFVEGVLPFKKTPVNIIRRGIEYSPIGLIKTLTKGTYDLKKENISASEYIDGIAGGLTGTGIVLMGMLLSSLGFIKLTGSFGDDEEDKFDKLTGKQEYAVEIGGISYTLDWAAPVCIPFFMGVELQRSLEEEGNGNLWQSIMNVGENALEPIINLSMLSGMQDVISSSNNASPGEQVGSVIWETALSYGSQLLPTIGGAVARTIDGTRRTTYIDKTSWLSDMGQMALNQIEAKIPFVSMMRSEYVDEFGRTQDNGNFFTRAIQNFVSPGYISDIENDSVIKELKELYEDTGESVLPDKPQKYIKIGSEKVHLSAEEYEEYAKEVGQARYEYAEEFIDSRGYSDLDKSERVEVLKDLYSYALAKGKKNASKYKLPNTYKKVYEAEKNGISPVDYYMSKIATNEENADTDKSGGVSKKEKLAAIKKMDVSDDIKAALIALYS